MLIRESPASHPSEVRRVGAGCSGDAEFFVREDGAGSIVVCAGDEAPASRSVIDRRVDVRFAAGRYGDDGGDWLFYVGLWTPDDYREEFLAWYELEHLPILLECPTWDGCRFVEQPMADGAQFYALHQLSDREALDSLERRHSRSTPWFKRLSQQRWFDGPFTRTLCRRIAA